MKKIYIVLTHTGTVLSKIVRFYTGKEFSHVSISLDKELNEMYSFGRLHAYNPFWGGFVHESLHSGTFKRFKDTKTKIFALDVPDDQYDMIKDLIYDMQSKKNKYRFNTIGLIGVIIHYKISRKNYFYCAEFVKYLFDNTDLSINLPDLIEPEDFKTIVGMKEIYTGFLREYNI